MNDLTNYEIEPLRQDGEFALARVARPNGLPSCLLVSPVVEQPVPSSLAKLENAFALRDDLDASWAARPVELVKFRGRLALVIEDPDGEFLDKKIDGPLAVPDFLRLAISIASSLGGLHGKGLVHKDVKPANLIANARTGEAWLTGFSLATRLPRHRQSAETPEIIAGTLPYMAPEQTGTVQGRARDFVIRTQNSGQLNVVVTVRDSGIGLDPATREQIFTAFHTTKPSGLGMGLSISRSIVENHCGRLWVAEHEGPGASFSFTLPSQSGRDV
jgi:hypothetical protein